MTLSKASLFFFLCEISCICFALIFMDFPLIAMEEDETGRASSSPPPAMSVDQEPSNFMDKMRRAGFRSFYKQKEEEKIRKEAETRKKKAQLVKIGNSEISSLMQLAYVNLNSQNLTTLPPGIGYLTKTVSLSFIYNELTVLPGEIGFLTALTKLNLYSNKLEVLPPEIGSLKALTHLDLYSNKLTALPSEIGSLRGLTELDCGCNKLTVLPPVMGSLKALTKLGLWYNQLTALPDTFIELTTLKELSLYGNQFRQPPTALISSLKRRGAFVIY